MWLRQAKLTASLHSCLRTYCRSSPLPQLSSLGAPLKSHRQVLSNSSPVFGTQVARASSSALVRKLLEICQSWTWHHNTVPSGIAGYVHPLFHLHSQMASETARHQASPPVQNGLASLFEPGIPSHTQHMRGLATQSSWMHLIESACQLNA